MTMRTIIPTAIARILVLIDDRIIARDVRIYVHQIRIAGRTRPSERKYNPFAGRGIIIP
jgi:hypothetical protein